MDESARRPEPTLPAPGSAAPATPVTPVPGPATPATPIPPADEPNDARRIRAVAWGVVISGIMGVMHRSLVLSARPGGIGPLVRGPNRIAALNVLCVVLGIALVLLAPQVRKRKRNAWGLALAAEIVLAVALGVLQPFSVSACLPALMVVILVWRRRDFPALPDPPSLFALARFVPVYLGAVYAYGLIFLWVTRSRLSEPLSPPSAVATVTLALFGVDGPITIPGRLGQVFSDTMLALAVIGLVWSLVLALRPLTQRNPHTAEDWALARRIVRDSGWDTLNYFALRDDKSFFFSASRKAMIAYTYIRGYGLAAGDPVGPPEELPEVIDEFLEFCRQRAWKPAFLAAREADRDLYESRNLRSFYLGDEAIIRCSGFSLEGKKNKSLRQSVGRVARTYTFALMPETDASPELIAELNAISARWRGKSPERGFTMSLNQDVHGMVPEFLLCVALDEHGVPGGFLRIVPAPGVCGHAPGYTLDLMRHDPGTPNGMTEFLIANTALALAERGVDRLSMNFAAFGRLFDPEIHYPWYLRVARWFVRRLNPYFQIESLRTFNAKFRPEWVGRVLVFKHPSDLPRVALLYMGAEGFLSLPFVGPLFVPRAVGGIGSVASAAVATDGS